MKGLFLYLCATAAVLGLALPQVGQTAEFSLDANDGIAFKSASGNFKARFGGRLQLDGALFLEDETPLRNDAIVRRARLSFRADLFKVWRFSMQYDLADEEERYASLWLRYSGFDNIDITIGQFQEPFGLEEATSSNNLIFMERSLANVLAPGTNVGVGVRLWDEHWSFNTGVFWETYIEDPDPFARREGVGVSGRLTYAPINSKHSVLHLGVSGSYRVPDDSGRVRFRTRPETYVTDERLISTGRMKDVEDYFSAGLEAAAMAGSLMVQGEYIKTLVSRTADRSDESFDGAYVVGPEKRTSR